MARGLVALLALTTIYAVMRYAGFGGVSPVHIPAFLLNKAISMSAAIALALAAQGLVRGRLDAYLSWTKASGHLAFVHVLLSLALISKGNYPAYHDADRMNLTGEAALLLGVLAVYAYWRVGLARAPRRLLTLLASAFLAGHLFVMGFRNWMQPAKWHGGLPPITLLSFCAAVFGLVQFLRVKHSPPKEADSPLAEGALTRT